MHYAGCKGQGLAFYHIADRNFSSALFLRRTDGSLTADPAEMDSLLRADAAWGGIMRKYANSPPPCWDTFLETYNRLLPDAAEMVTKPISVDDVTEAIARMKHSTSPGMHGWRVHELSQLPNTILKQLATTLNAIERDAEWPAPLRHAQIPLIPKPESTGEPLSQRPITVTPVIYRIWAAIRARGASSWLDKFVPHGIHGCRPKHSAEDLFWNLAAALEHAHLNSQPLHGIAVDFKKCFDTVPTEIAFKLAERLGFNQTVLHTLRAAYDGMERHFKAGGSIGEGFTPTNGIMQGCALSVALINLVISVWVLDVEDGGDSGESYVDDIYGITNSRSHAQQIADKTALFSHRTLMDISIDKTHTFSTSSSPLTVELKTWDVQTGALVSQTPPVYVVRRDSFDCLGTMLHARPQKGQSKSKRIKAREKAIEENLRRVRTLPTPPQHREQIACMSAGSKSNWGASVSKCDASRQSALRKNFLAAVWTGTDRQAPEAVCHILHRGHRLDPLVAPAYHQIQAWARQVSKSPHAVAYATAAWNQEENLAFGPMKFVSEAFAQAGWTWASPTSVAYTDEVGQAVTFNAVNPSNKALAKMQHDLRTALRLGQMRELAERRPDFAGVEQGVDGMVTRHLLENGSSGLTAYQNGILRSVLAGAVATTGRTGMPEGNCPYCMTEHRETVEHLCWECTAWEEVRARHPIARADRTRWPACLAICGIAPAFDYSRPEHLQPLPWDPRKRCKKGTTATFLRGYSQRETDTRQAAAGDVKTSSAA